jgi:hypothetical protein
MQIDVSIYVSFVTGILLPFLIAYIRSRYASSQFAALLTMFLTMFLTRAFLPGQPLSGADYARLYLLDAIAVTMTAWQTFSRLYQPLGWMDKLEQLGLQRGNGPAPAPVDHLSAD